MVSIRMKKFGMKAQPYYRIVAVDSRKKRDGAVLEELGYYHPIIKDEKAQVKIDKEKIQKWLDVGAQPSDTVKKILNKNDLKITRKLSAK